MTLSRFQRAVFFTVVIGVTIVVSQLRCDRPRVLAVNEVPIAFWAWRSNAPNQADVRNAFAATNASTLFLRAGQFDLKDEGIERIRSVGGAMPTGVELHLVYNATRDFLAAWEQMDPHIVADEIAGTYKADLARARLDAATVRGLQLDLDIPTRLLPKYAETLHALRTLLPSGTALSITGLPTWTDGSEIQVVLAEVDFWIPQCYGGRIPTHLDERIPIASPTEIERTIQRARRLGAPFYAGLAAYSYAILYASDGSLVELRGNIDPVRAVAEPDLRLIERAPFTKGDQASEIRYELQAKDEVVLEGLIIKKGETLVIDVPTAATLRRAARVARENGGEMLRGICLFRLPLESDSSTLSVAEVRAALTDLPTQSATDVTVTDAGDGRLAIRAENQGNASSILGDGAITIDIEIDPGSFEKLTGMSANASYEALCRSVTTGTLVPCSETRANVVRLKAHSWRPADSASANIKLKRNALPVTRAVVTMHIDDGRVEHTTVELAPKRGMKNEP